MEYFYGQDASGYRWWRAGDLPDSFDVIDKAELDRRIASAKTLGHKVTDHLPAFCDWDDCPDCKDYK